MKKYRAISLIETLISLAIVGIALIALLPVVTVKKDGFDATKGNGLWVNDTTTASICGAGANTKCPVEIGDISTTAPESLLINTNGLSNSSLVPLNILGRLSIHGQNIESSASGAATLFFHAYAGAENWVPSGPTDTLKGYNTNLYYDNNKVVIQNDEVYDTDFSFERDYDTPANNNSSKRRTNNITKYISLSNKRNEYIYNDSTVNAAGAAKNIVSIGVNSGKSPSISSSTNLISIFNAKNVPVTPEATGFNGILIGALTDNDESNLNYGKPNNKFAIVKNDNEGAIDNHFHIYAPFQVNGLNVASILIASDKRLKNITSKYKKGLKEILKINPVEYTLKSDKEKTPHVGVIAQDLQKIFPASVSKNKDGYLMVSEEETFYALLNAIKELNTKNKKIADENKNLELKIAQLRKIRDDLKASKGGKNE